MTSMLFIFFLAFISSSLTGARINDVEGALREKQCSEGIYGIGVGQSDITGPIADAAMMGYADPSQRALGLHTRLRSRAFVFDDPCTGTIKCFAVADLGMIFSSVKQGVLDHLARELPGVFSHDNLLLSATHTHSGPGGYAFYPLYNITTLGFDQQNYEAIVNGIAESILRAHRAVVSGTMSYGHTVLEGVTHNRSSVAYLNNPLEELSAYQSSTNSNLYLIKLQGLDNKLLGVMSWFAIHPVSLTLKNRLVSSDNKGLAAYYLERRMKVTYRQENEFVAAFAQADEGDVSPYDVANPPKGDAQEFAQLELVAQRQSDAVWELLNQDLQPIKGPIDTRHQFVDMPNYKVLPEFTGSNEQSLCSAALGLSFAAGTENGRPNIAIFDEGLISHEPNDSCQQEKPVLIEAGRWGLAPNTLPFHIMRIGQLLVLGAPGEMTTMAGRKLRAAIAAQFDGPIIIAGLSNEYSHYISTRSEYAMQHYEGASTLYGPWTEAAYRQIFSRLTTALINNYPVAAGPAPADMSYLAKSLSLGVIMDQKPFGTNFGDVSENAKESYLIGQKVRVKFIGGHPNNDLRSNDSYLTVEREQSGKFEKIYFDWDPTTILRFERVRLVRSLITVEWQTTTDDALGTYRICHQGAAKGFFSSVKPYSGCSRAFKLVR